MRTNTAQVMGDMADWFGADGSSWEDGCAGEWVTQDGQILFFEEMTTSHLFYSVRMIYNHTAPAAYQIPGCKRYAFDWPAEVRREAINGLMQELSTRRDIAPWMIEQLRHMRDCIRTLKIPALNPAK